MGGGVGWGGGVERKRVKNREEVEGTPSGKEARCIQIQESVEKCLCSGYSYVPSHSYLTKASLACATLKKKSTPLHCKSSQYSQLGRVFLILDINSLMDADRERVYSHTIMRLSKATFSSRLSRDKTRNTVLPTEHQTSLSC